MFFRKLPARCAPAVMPLLLSVLMTRVVSTVSTLCSFGVGTALVSAFASASPLLWLGAFAALLAVLPLVRRIVGLLVVSSGPAAHG